MRFFLSLLILFFCLVLVSCSEDAPTLSCGEEAIISDRELDTAPRDQAVINSLRIAGDCLIINMSASGCDASTWEVKLIGSESLLEFLPSERSMVFSLKNDEECEAFLTREFTFDITPTRSSESSVWLNFINASQRILYTYH